MSGRHKARSAVGILSMSVLAGVAIGLVLAVMLLTLIVTW